MLSIRRGSVDTGGLALSLCDPLVDSGRGWFGRDWEDGNIESVKFIAPTISNRLIVRSFARLVVEMHAQTTAAVSCPCPPIPVLQSSSRSRLLHALSGWHFEPFRLGPEEVLHCGALIFESLLMLPDLPPAMSSLSIQDQILPFLTHLRSLYRSANRYHSFIHAVDVLQAIYCFLERSGSVPPITMLLVEDQPPCTRKDSDGLLHLLSSGDIFMLCLAAIGHDVGHPGNSNAFLVSEPVSLCSYLSNGFAEKCTSAFIASFRR